MVPEGKIESSDGGKLTVGDDCTVKEGRNTYTGKVAAVGKYCSCLGTCIELMILLFSTTSPLHKSTGMTDTFLCSCKDIGRDEGNARQV